jgi:hypothetical protein
MNRRLTNIILVCSLTLGLGTFVQFAAASDSAMSSPPDTTGYSRAPTSDEYQGGVSAHYRGAFAPVVRAKVFVKDVNDVDFVDGSEPSLGVNRATESEDSGDGREIVVHGGFGGWNGNARVFRSIDNGESWASVNLVPPPPGALGTVGCPCDTTLDFDRGGLLAGSFLTFPQTNLYTGSTDDPSNSAAWNWFLVAGNAQRTNLVATNSADQPWVLTNRVPGGRDENDESESNVYVAYDDFSVFPVGERVAAASFTNPPNFTIDNQTGGGGGNINPGHRLATDPDSGFVYSLFELCSANCGSLSANPKTIQYILNRSTDGGVTWSLNGSSTGIVVATADSTQPNPKFGTVNALLGGVEHAAVDPKRGDVYVVYGNRDSGTGNNRLAIRRLKNNGAGGVTIGAEHFVTGQVQAALPSVAVVKKGIVGVLYDTFDGFSGSGFPIFTAHFALSRDRGVSFTDIALLSFLSPATDNGNARQRVLGDYQQVKAVGRTFYGVFSGNGAALGRSLATIDPIFFRIEPKG